MSGCANRSSHRRESSNRQFAAQPDISGGRIVTFTSGQHLEPMPAELPYSVTKGAVHEMTPGLAAALADRAITVNCVNPGPVDTGWADADLRQTLAGRHPRGKWGTPEDAAKVVRWLVDDAADWITGQTIVCDGGWSLRLGTRPSG